MQREIRVSDDGDRVAMRSDSPAEAWNAWFVANTANLTHPGAGGHWAALREVQDWRVLQDEEGSS